jgi:hypothetical protein
VECATASVFLQFTEKIIRALQVLSGKIPVCYIASNGFSNEELEEMRRN